jgi:hypothetical protein
MSTTPGVKAAVPNPINARLLSRILDEGYGPGAWHGPDLKAALADVSSELAFWRPAPERHNIAEIALHHAYCAHSVRARLSGSALEPFMLEGEDWFALPGPTNLAWSAIQATVDMEQHHLVTLVAEIGNGRLRSPLPEAERFDLVLGITCHAIYHAGQIQLIKRLHAV